MFSPELLHDLREWEIARIVSYFPPGARILELGAGTGQQALALSQHGFQVDAIELPDSLYAGLRVFPIKDYDGFTIPFAEQTFDVVFSSSVLEHVPDLARLHSEIRRVLKRDGAALHVVPNHGWRFWTTVSAFPAALQAVGDMQAEVWPRRIDRTEMRRLASTWRRLVRHLVSPFFQHRHGERGNVISEMWFFHPNWWRKNFSANGFRIERQAPMGLFYTGNMAIGARWNVDTRVRLASVLGSACHLFVMRPADD